MPLPEKFNRWKHLLSTLVILQNKIVENHFNPILGTNPKDNITDPQASLYQACTLSVTDAAEAIALKLFLFYVILRKAQDLQAPLYGTPCENYHDSVEFKPQVKLIFSEKKLSAYSNDRIPIRAVISFRLMNKTTQTLTEDEVKALALAIKNVMVNEPAKASYKFAKGAVKVSYRDTSNGYHMILAVKDEAEGIEVIKKVLSIQNHQYQESCLSVSNSKKSFTPSQDKVNILGAEYRKPNYRPAGDVYFKRAELSLHGLFKDILLVCDGDYLDSKPYEVFWNVQ